MLSSVIFLAIIIGGCYFAYKLIKNCRPNSPTWKGIIISALLGMLPFYLVLCFLGLMGEERKGVA